ncbi:MAG: hypothetical protein K1X55_15675 [Chitinophagales bacterium]|nr:hypothetical protein [Chitinophagales bacterium]
MQKQSFITSPFFSLTLVSLVGGLIWRAEVEYHGWEGLIWIGYFHYAIPLAYGLFILWANIFLQITIKKRVLLNIAPIIFGVIIYLLLKLWLVYRYSSGMTGLLMEVLSPRWKLILIRYSIFIIIPLIPIGTFFILKMFKIKIPLKTLVISIICFIISIPLSIALLELVNHKGGSDFIHAIKSGFLIPLWAFSIGILIDGHVRTTKKDEVRA